jgi:hypothetical protein
VITVCSLAWYARILYGLVINIPTDVEFLISDGGILVIIKRIGNISV